MSATVFVDTNVFVYARDAGERRKQPLAAEWLRKLWVEQRGRTSMQVLSEYYATVTRKLDPGLAPDEAWEDVRALLAWEPQDIGRDVMLRGREIERRYLLSWWDSLVVAAAQLQNCSVLLTEDLQRGLVCGTVTIKDPFTEGVAEETSVYAPKPVSRHRPRGRPRSQAR
jgi:predicted nucleic acid-binding protein